MNTNDARKKLRRSIQRLIFIVIASFAMAPPALASSAKKPQKTLPFPGLADSLQTLDRSLDAVSVANGQIFTFSDGERHVVRTPLKHGAAATREERFGKITDSQRLSVYADGGETPTVRGAVVSGNRLLLMDGALLTIIDVFRDDMKESLRRTIPLDVIKPPRDRGGEPPAFEIRDYRKKFKQQLLKAKGLPFVGLAPVPKSFRTKGNELLVLSSIPGFPLLILECRGEDPAQCFAARGCFAKFGQDFKPKEVRGVATHAGNKWILVGDPKSHKIRVLQFSSCYQITEIGSLFLPEKMKSMRGLWIDEESNLWVATAEPDWYHNASLYMWPQKDWTTALE